MSAKKYRTEGGQTYWRVNFWAKNATGSMKRIKRSKFPTRELAEAWMNRFRAEAFESAEFPERKRSKLTVAEAWKLYEPVSKTHRSYTTERARAGHYCRHLGKRECMALTVAEIEDYRAKRATESTVRGGLGLGLDGGSAVPGHVEAKNTHEIRPLLPNLPIGPAAVVRSAETVSEDSAPTDGAMGHSATVGRGSESASCQMLITQGRIFDTHPNSKEGTPVATDVLEFFAETLEAAANDNGKTDAVERVRSWRRDMSAAEAQTLSARIAAAGEGSADEAEIMRTLADRLGVCA